MESLSNFESFPCRRTIFSAYLFGSQRLVGPGGIWASYKPRWETVGEESPRKDWLSWFSLSKACYLIPGKTRQEMVWTKTEIEQGTHLDTPATNQWKAFLSSPGVGRVMYFECLEREKMSSEFLSHLCFTSKTKDDNSSVQSRTQEMRHLFSNILSSLWNRACEVSQSWDQVCTALEKLWPLFRNVFQVLVVLYVITLG